MRTYDASLVKLRTDQMAEELTDRFSAETWLADTSNIALSNDIGDVALFEPHGSVGVMKGHYFFISRGKDAVIAARIFLQEIFSGEPDYGRVDRLIGFTQLSKKGALWLTRHLGFTPVSIETINGEDFQVWTMHKKEFECLAF